MALSRTLFYPLIYLTIYQLRGYTALLFSSEIKYQIITLNATRVVANFNILNGSNGVPIEYWYNETAKDNKHQSSPGCPESIDGYPWVYYGSPPKCFLVSFAGPCQGGMKMALELGSLYGVCTCECFLEKKEYQLHLPSVSGPYISCVGSTRTPNIYDKLERKCYTMFEQGPCSDGEVIASWTNNSLTCLPLCNHKFENWRELKRMGRCTRRPIRPRASIFSLHIEKRSCPENQYWSHRLRRCVYKRSIGENAVG